jgi:hypothetical protein
VRRLKVWHEFPIWNPFWVMHFCLSNAWLCFSDTYSVLYINSLQTVLRAGNFWEVFRCWGLALMYTGLVVVSLSSHVQPHSEVRSEQEDPLKWWCPDPGLPQPETIREEISRTFFILFCFYFFSTVTLTWVLGLPVKCSATWSSLLANFFP